MSPGENGIELAEFFELPQGLPEPVKKEINVIENHICDKDELCAVMQLEDGILQPVTPDIIGECR